MDVAKPIVFYDIASRPPATTYAPNPWKTRYALNFKGVHYRTEWVELPNVTATRKRLGVPANRQHWDGSPFYTLPIIHNPSTGELIGDTFDIALYLDKTYPNGPTLFPPSTVGLMRAFNKQIDAVFTNHVLLCVQGIPFNPDSLEEMKASFLYRMQKDNWDDLTVRDEARTKTLESLKAGLEDVSKFYSNNNSGSFLEGQTPTYADLIVGAWLQFYKATLPAEEWEALQTWHDGLWKKIHLALDKYAEVKY